MKRLLSFSAFGLAALAIASPCANAQDPARVRSHQKISSSEGGFLGVVEDMDQFGEALASLGDLDGDGGGDIAVGSICDNDGGDCRGAVWVLFLNADGTVKANQKISDTQGGFTGVLDDFDLFGGSVTPLGDFDGDGVCDVAVGATGDDDGGESHGAVWILFLNANGTVKGYQKISDTQGGFTGVLDDDFFGWSVVSPGDIDDDGVDDLAVGAYLDDDSPVPGYQDSGAVWILFLNADGTVKAHQKISATQGGLNEILVPLGAFGFALGALGDLDGDGVEDLAVGNPGEYPVGAVWILFLNADGTVKAHQKISDVEGGFSGRLYDNEGLGDALDLIGDLDGDGIDELAVGAIGDGDGGLYNGALWILFLNTDGTVRAQRKISATKGGFQGQLDTLDYFGRSVSSVGDLDNDGFGDLAVGAARDDDGGIDRGAVWILFMGGLRPASHFLPFSGTIHTGDTIDLPVLIGDEACSPIAVPGAVPLVVLGTRAVAPERAARTGLAIDPRSVLAILPATSAVTIPRDPALIGQGLYVQILLFDPWRTGRKRFTLCLPFELRID